MKLNSRQQNILRATVRHYVNTAEPVGSKSLAKGYDLQVSSATIRNVMSALEGSGLLYQPHTSAGRIPSDSGYRMYVDKLMMLSEPLTRQMETALSSKLDWSQLDWDSQAMEVLLKESAQVLSRLSGHIALVTLPHMDASVIKQLKLVPVSDSHILLIVIDIYNNHSCLLPIAGKHEDIDAELQVLSNFLTEQLRGRSLHDADLDWSNLGQVFQGYATILQRAIADLSRKSRTLPTTQILISGVAEALDQPEFAEREQIRSIVQLLEDGRDQLWPLISDPMLLGTKLGAKPGDSLSAQQGIRIWIGAENPLEPMRSCALVATQYGRAPGPTGSLGVLGPTRMLYENAVAAVGAAANYLTDAVSAAFAGSVEA